MACIACHMPFSVKLATSTSPLRGDARSHQFKIWVSEFPKDSMFVTEGDQQFLRTDENGMAVGNTLDLACNTCHVSWSIETLLPFAENIHQEGLKVSPQPQSGAPGDFVLKQNYPNPFNSFTTIEFSIPRGGYTELSLFNTAGELVRTIMAEELDSGTYKVPLDAGNLPSGVYFYHLKSAAFSQSKKLVLVK